MERNTICGGRLVNVVIYSRFQRSKRYRVRELWKTQIQLAFTKDKSRKKTNFCHLFERRFDKIEGKNQENPKKSKKDSHLNR